MSQKSESETKNMFIRQLWHFPQHFDTYFQLLFPVTKFNRAKLVVFAFSDYNFAENSNDLRSPDFQDFHFQDVWPPPFCLFKAGISLLFINSKQDLFFCLLAPTGALVLMMVYYISAAAAAATFSDFEHLCLSILLQVSL